MKMEVAYGIGVDLFVGFFWEENGCYPVVSSIFWEAIAWWENECKVVVGLGMGWLGLEDACNEGEEKLSFIVCGVEDE